MSRVRFQRGHQPMQLDNFARVDDSMELRMIFQALEPDIRVIRLGQRSQRLADIHRGGFEQSNGADDFLNLFKAQNQCLRIGLCVSNIGDRKIFEPLLQSLQ